MNKQLFAASTANVTLAAALTANAATIQLSVADAALFPALAAGSGDYFLLSLGGGSDVRKVTAINKGTGVLTSAGTVEGTATSWPSGSSVVNAITAGTMNGLTQGVIIQASGDTTGATDAAAINNALALFNRVTLQPGAQYYLNAPVTMGSNTVLTAYGAKLKLVAGVAGNILRNKAVLASRTVSDASVIAGIAYFLSATANFVAGDVGSMVGIFGAAATGAAWYGPILSIITPANATAWAASTAKTVGAVGRPVSANGNLYQVTTAGTTGTTEPTWPTTATSTVTDGTVTWTCMGAATGATLNKPALLSVSNATANVYATADRNDNITVIGGSYEITDNLSGGHITTSTFQNSFASAFRRVSNLRIKDTTWTTYGPVNQGGRFTISISDFSNVQVDNTNFISTSGDGVHLTGPGDTALVTNTHGTTGDDMNVCNMQDGNTPYVMDTEGDLINLTFRDGVAKNVGSRAFCAYDIGASNRWTLTNLLVEDFSGVSFNPMVLINSNVYGLVIRKIAGGPNQAGTPLVSFVAFTGNTGQGATIEDVTWINTLPATSGIIRIADPRGPFSIKNVRFNSAPAGTNYGVYLNGTLNGSGFGIPVLNYDGFYTGSDNAYAPSDATALYFGFTNASSGDTTVNMKNIFSRSSTGYAIQKTASGQVNRFNISDSQIGGTAMASFPASDNPTTLSMKNMKVFAPVVKTSSVVTVEMSNVDITTNAVAIQLTGTGAGATIRMANSGMTGSGALVSRDGTQSIRVRGTDIPVDQALLNPQDGDMIYNNNATPTNGTGVAMYNTPAAKWKNLYSGLTN